MNAPKRTASSYPKTCFQEATKATFENNEEQADDDNYEFDFDDYNTLYCVPNEAAECFNIFSQDTLDALNQDLSESEKYPPILNFSSVHAMRQYLDGTNFPLEKYNLQIPATKYKSVRFDKRLSHASALEISLIHK